MQSRLNLPVEVLNLGLSGANTINELTYLKRMAPEFKPDTRPSPVPSIPTWLLSLARKSTSKETLFLTRWNILIPLIALHPWGRDQLPTSLGISGLAI